MGLQGLLGEMLSGTDELYMMAPPGTEQLHAIQQPLRTFVPGLPSKERGLFLHFFSCTFSGLIPLKRTQNFILKFRDFLLL